MANTGWDWDHEFVCDPNAFTVLENGDYDFTIKKIERTQYSGNSTKIPSGCNTLEVSVECTDGINTSTIKDNIYLYDGNAWKLSQILMAVGAAKEGSKYSPGTLMQCIGMSGRCSVTKTTSDRGNEFNNIKKYYTKNSNPTAGFQQSSEQAPAAFTAQAPKQESMFNKWK